MIRFCSVMLMAVLCVSVASAQERAQREGRGGGRGGGFGASRVGLLAIEEVQAELKLSEDQKARVEEIARSLRPQGGGGAGGDRQARMEAFQKQLAEAETKLDEVLDETQQARLTGLYIQRAGVSAVTNAKVAEKLELTDEQKAEIAKIQEAQRQELRDQFAALNEGGGEDARARFREIREQTEEKLTAVLTDEQKQKLESLEGEKFEFPQRQRGEGRNRGGDR